MKILHYINNLGAGGAEKLLSDILPEMVKQGHTVILVYSNSRNNITKFDNIIRNSKVRIYDFDLSIYNPIQIFKIIKILWTEKPDIVHSHIFPTQYWLSFSKIFYNKSCAFIKTEHNVTNSRRTKAIFKPIEKFVYSRYDGIIAITEEVAKSLSEWLNSNKKIVIIKNGVNVKQVNEEKSLPLLLNMQKNNFNILMVGSFSNNQKDQESLISALEFLPSNVNVFFAGDGLRMDQMRNDKKFLKFSQQVHFLGMRDDVYTLMSNVDLNVLSTNYEGLSGVALESMASGQPFIGSDVAGVNDVVPSNDFLFPAKNPRAMAAKISNIIIEKEFREQLIRTGKLHVKSYDISHMIVNYLDYYKKIMHL